MEGSAAQPAVVPRPCADHTPRASSSQGFTPGGRGLQAAARHVQGLAPGRGGRGRCARTARRPRPTGARCGRRTPWPGTGTPGATAPPPHPTGALQATQHQLLSGAGGCVAVRCAPHCYWEQACAPGHDTPMDCRPSHAKAPSNVVHQPSMHKWATRCLQSQLLGCRWVQVLHLRAGAATGRVQWTTRALCGRRSRTQCTVPPGQAATSHTGNMWPRNVTRFAGPCSSSVLHSLTVLRNSGAGQSSIGSAAWQSSHSSSYSSTGNAAAGS